MIPKGGMKNIMKKAQELQDKMENTYKDTEIVMASDGFFPFADNIIEASWIALNESLHFKLMRDAIIKANLKVGSTGTD